MTSIKATQTDNEYEFYQQKNSVYIGVFPLGILAQYEIAGQSFFFALAVFKYRASQLARALTHGRAADTLLQVRSHNLH
jgi:hypothetical protein